MSIPGSDTAFMEQIEELETQLTAWREKNAQLLGKMAMMLNALNRASTSLGAFCSDHGWSMEDMNNMDCVDATISATQPEVESFLNEVRAKAE